MSPTPPTLAIVLAGGRASRMGGADKPALTVHGRRLLDIALAASAHLDTTVVVGPRRPDLADDIVQTQERPARSGPVAAIWAATEAVEAPADTVVVVLASDLPNVGAAALDRLIAATSPASPVTCAADEEGRTQFLFSAWTLAELRRRLTALRDVTGLADQPMKALVTAPFSTLPVSGTQDCDTPADIDRARTHTRLTVEQARTIVAQSVMPLTPRRARLDDSLGGTLAEPLVSRGDLPASDVSAMDGYAVSGSGPWRVRTEICAAGGRSELTLSDGEAVRIATGAHLPGGASAVVRDEYAALEGDPPQLRRLPIAPTRNDARRRGEDWVAGVTLAPAGTPVSAAVVSAAASGEVFDALIRGPVRAHLVVTGDEICRSGPLREGHTRDSVGAILPHVLARSGVRCVADTHLRDTADGFERIFAGQATGSDVIVVVGATGGGAADEMRSALARLGARTLVGRVAVRPGGSQIIAVLPDGTVVLGLPGNPYAAVATLLTMLPFVVGALTARPVTAPLLGVVENAAAVSSDVARLLPVVQSADGRWRVDTSVHTAHLAGLIGRTALAVIPPLAGDDTVAELVLIPV